MSQQQMPTLRVFNIIAFLLRNINDFDYRLMGLGPILFQMNLAKKKGNEMEAIPIVHICVRFVYVSAHTYFQVSAGKRPSIMWRRAADPTCQSVAGRSAEVEAEAKVQGEGGHHHARGDSCGNWIGA